MFKFLLCVPIPLQGDLKFSVSSRVKQLSWYSYRLFATKSHQQKGPARILRSAVLSDALAFNRGCPGELKQFSCWCRQPPQVSSPQEAVKPAFPHPSAMPWRCSAAPRAVDTPWLLALTLSLHPKGKPSHSPRLKGSQLSCQFQRAGYGGEHFELHTLGANQINQRPTPVST